MILATGFLGAIQLILEKQETLNWSWQMLLIVSVWLSNRVCDNFSWLDAWGQHMFELGVTWCNK